MTERAEIARDGAPTLLVESSKALPIVATTVAFKSGAVDDPQGKEGLSRLVARLMRRTAGGHTAEVIDERIDAMGGSMGVDVSHSSLSIHGTVIARSLDEFASLVADTLSKPGLTQEELGRLQRETEAELIESRDNDRGLARRWFRNRLFGGHPYSRSVSGTIASLKDIDRDDVVAHYERCIAGGNPIIALAGDVDASRAEAVAEQMRGALRPGRHLVSDPPDPSVRPGRHLVIVDKPERTQTQILIGTLGSHPADEDHIALHVANTIFGGTFTARLMNEVRSKRGWSYGAHSSLPYDRRRRGFTMSTAPKTEDAAPCVELQLSLLEAWWESGVTKKELEWAKRYLVRSHAFSIDTPAKRVALSLDEAIYDLPPRYHSDYVQRVRSVTLEQVNASIRNRISTKDLLVVVVGTASQIRTGLEGAISGHESTEVISFDTDG